jgi:hypothetical protein
MPDERFTELESVYNHVLHDIDLYVYLPVEFRLAEDGVRSTDVQYRDEIDGLFFEEVQNRIPEDNVLMVTGSVDNRVAMVRKRIAERKVLFNAR